jgi:hypothetical protein
MPRSEEQAFRAKVESKSGEFTDGKGTPLVSIEGAALEMGTPVGSRDFE